MANTVKNQSINIRVTPKQKKFIEEKAKIVKMSLTEFILISCQKSRIQVLSEGQAIAEEFHKLRLQVKERGCEIALDKQLEAIMLKLDTILSLISNFNSELQEQTEDIDEEETDEDWWEDET